MSFEKNLVIGLDIGTSSIKLVILNIRDNLIEFELSESIQDSLVNLPNKERNEQNVDIIFNILNHLIGKISGDRLERVKAIQLTGQMHGFLLWNTETGEHTNLVNWQDQRCTKEFLEKEIPIRSNVDLNSGYGIATLFWYFFNGEKNNVYLSKYNACGTIQDYITYIFSKNNSIDKKHHISTHNALSWGYFDKEALNWQENLLNLNGFPVDILPKIVEPSTKLSNSISLLNSKTYPAEIYAALGDLQCSVFSCLEYETDCVINVSTSAQICMVIDKNLFESIKSEIPQSVSTLPYFNNKILLAFTSLNGGNVIEKFVEWCTQISLLIENKQNYKDIKEIMWDKLIEEGTKFSKKNFLTVLCKPLFFGERHNTATFASFENLSNTNSSIGEIFTAICRGLIRNLKETITEDLLFKKLKCNRIIATGSAIIRNNVLKSQLESEFDYIPIVYKSTGDAALGASYFLRNLLIN